MADTQQNLKDAFAGESQANRRYLAFAIVAEREGFPEVAKRFRAAAESETIHALAHLRTLGEVGSTAENLKAAMGGENYEHTSMYPEFMQVAESEGQAEAKESFRRANEAEKFHEQMFSDALENLESLTESKFYVCQECGMTYRDEVPDECVVCGFPREQILEVH
ncbi:MAG: rubrerythrin family protein [Thermoleophilia bacterium]